MTTDLRFGTFLAPNILPVYRAVTEGVARRLGMTAGLTVAASYREYLDDRYDVAFICSLPQVVFEREGTATGVPVAAPVLSGDRYGGLPIYFSDVIVRGDSPHESFEELRGAAWAYNEPLSQSGYGITRYHLVRLGATQGFFGRMVAAGFHERAIRLVRDGAADAAAIDSQVLAVAMRHDPGLAEELRVIDVLGPSTIQPVVVSRRLDPALRTAVRDAVVDVHRDPAAAPELAAGIVDRFVPVTPDSYADVRDMLDACLTAGFVHVH